MAQNREGRRGPAQGIFMPGGRFGEVQKPKNMAATVARLWRLFGREQWKLISVFAIATVGSGVGLLGPWLIGRGVDAMAAAGGVDFGRLYGVIVLLGAAYAAGGALSWLQEWWIAGVAQPNTPFSRSSAMRASS